MSQSASILALDLGKVRVGVARASWPDGIPTPLTTLKNDSSLAVNLTQLVASEHAEVLVAGKPMTLSGTDSKQTRYTLEIVRQLETVLPLKIYLQDESATSLQAEAELKRSRGGYDKADIDALSAVYILEDFIREHPGGRGL